VTFLKIVLQRSANREGGGGLSLISVIIVEIKCINVRRNTAVFSNF
jgi:hypothetical protein